MEFNDVLKLDFQSKFIAHCYDDLIKVDQNSNTSIKHLKGFNQIQISKVSLIKNVARSNSHFVQFHIFINLILYLLHLFCS